MRASCSALAAFVLVALVVLPGCRTGGTPPAAAEPVDAPLDEAPPLQEFVLGPGDEVRIRVWRHPELDTTTRVSLAGTVSMVPVGDLQAKGVAVGEFRDLLTEALGRYYKEPNVGVEVLSSRRTKVYVLGEVQKPGVYNYDAEEQLNVVAALSQAGGFTEDANRKQVMVIRGTLETANLHTFNFKQSMKEGDLADNIGLRAGDVVFVPRSAIANVDRFFEHFKTIVSPLLDAERIRVLEDDTRRTSISF